MSSALAFAERPGRRARRHAELADLDGAGLRAGLHAVGLDPLERVRRALFELEPNHRRNDVRSAGTVRRAEETRVDDRALEAGA